MVTGIQFAKFLNRQLRNPEVLAAYDDARRRSALLDALVNRRLALGLTQTDVAKSMGVRQPTVAGFEAEDSEPRLSTLQRYARAVGMNVLFVVEKADAEPYSSIADEREARTREAIAVGIEALRDRDLEPCRTAPITVPTDSAAGLVERAYNAAIDVAQKGGKP